MSSPMWHHPIWALMLQTLSSDRLIHKNGVVYDCRDSDQSVRVTSGTQPIAQNSQNLCLPTPKSSTPTDT